MAEDKEKEIAKPAPVKLVPRLHARFINNGQSELLISGIRVAPGEQLPTDTPQDLLAWFLENGHVIQG